MLKYDKNHIAQLFDDMTNAKRVPTDKQITGLGKNIPQVAGQVAFERLELTGEDVLLDVGTGTGDKAIADAYICRQVIGIDIITNAINNLTYNGIYDILIV